MGAERKAEILSGVSTICWGLRRWWTHAADEREHPERADSRRVLVCVVGFVTAHRWLGLPGGLLAFLAAVEQMVRTDRGDRSPGD